MLSFYGNEKSIQQLVNILLDNALKYSPEGSTVRVKVQKQNRMIQLLVCNATDNAISKEELNLLFERFYRRDPSRNTQTGGYGIGLSVAKAIVTAHNGKIWAGTGDGQELQITVSFPSERTAKV